MSVSIVGRVAALAAEYPSSVAVVDQGGMLSFGELERFSNGLAHLVAAAKPAGDAFVVVMLPRTRLFVVAAFGAMKAGCAYVFVNPAYPDDRVRAILAETRPVRFVTTQTLWEARGSALGLKNAEVIRIDALVSAELDVSPIDLTTPDQNAFVIYTSGTTGKPKGVVHTQRMLSAIVAEHPVVAREDVDTARYAIVVDLAFIATSVFLYRALASGGECHIVGEEVRLDLRRLADYLNEHRIAKAFVGSSMGVALLGEYELTSTTFYMGGEGVTGLTPESVAKARSVVNLYGMSEMAPMTAHAITGDEKVVPAGRPLPGVTLHVLDEGLREVPAGTIGEIYAHAAWMAKEYLAMPEASAERFVADPFAPGRRLLRTGDRGFIDANGELMLCGRTDNMVKLRGQRIETGEIEVVARSFPGLGASACVVRPVNGSDQLCLYFEGPEGLDRAALHAHLVRKVTSYMVPSVLVRLESLPRNERGKIDRKALPDPLATFQPACVPPESDNERGLYEIAAELLKSRGFGVTDDLFALGMTSLVAMEMVARAGKEGLRLKVSDVMRDKTVRAIIHRRTSMVWWYAPYDPSKDVAVFVHGIALTKNIGRKLRMWSADYNVLVIEAIQEHYRYVFEGDDVTEVADLYYALVDHYLSSDAKVRVTTGVSFGGKLAYLLACRLRDGRGQLPAVVMGDSHLTCQQEVVDAVLAGTMDKWMAEHKVSFNSSFVERMTIMIRTEQGRNAIPPYDGRVVLLHSLSPSLVFPPGNDERWRRHASNLAVVPMSFRHDVISLDNDDTMPTWEAVARAIRLWDRAATDEASMRAVVAELKPEIRQGSLGWTDRIELLTDAPPSESCRKLVGEGTDLLYKLDFGASDCQSLFVPIWPMSERCFAWWMSMFAGAYFFRPEESPAPDYRFTEAGGTLAVDAPEKFNTWIYLPTKEAYPADCVLTFDYTTKQAMKETLQLCFCFDTLAERYRFVLNDNASLGFEVVSRGRFFAHDNEEWRRFRKPWSLTLGARTPVRLELCGDTFRLFLDGRPAMSVRVKGHVPRPSRLAVIAWNGLGTAAMKVRIENLKVYAREDGG